MNLKNTLQDELNAAMRSKDTVRNQTIRLVLTSVKLAEVERGSISDLEITSIIQKEIKSRKEVIEDAKKAQREDLINANNLEIAVLESFLPKQLSEDEIKNIISQVIQETGASGMKEMGAVMKSALDKIAGRAPNSQVSSLVREQLNNL